MPEPADDEFLGIKFELHAVPEKALEDPCPVVYYKGQDAFLIKVPRKEGVKAVVNGELAHIYQHLLRVLKHEARIKAELCRSEGH